MAPTQARLRAVVREFPFPGDHRLYWHRTTPATMGPVEFERQRDRPGAETFLVTALVGGETSQGAPWAEVDGSGRRFEAGGAGSPPGPLPRGSCPKARKTASIGLPFEGRLP